MTEALYQLLFRCPNIQITTKEGPANLLQMVAAKGGLSKSERLDIIIDQLKATLPTTPTQTRRRQAIKLTEEQQNIQLLVDALEGVADYFAQQEEKLANEKATKIEARRVLSLIDEAEQEDQVRAIKAMTPEQRAALRAQVKTTLA